MSGLNVLITNLKYSSRSGTETYVRDLGLELLRQVHHPVIFTPVAGRSRRDSLDLGQWLKELARSIDLYAKKNNVAVSPR